MGHGPRLQKSGNIDATLTADGGTVYTPVEATTSNGIDFADAGFARYRRLVFEVNPSDLKDSP